MEAERLIFTGIDVYPEYGFALKPVGIIYGQTECLIHHDDVQHSTVSSSGSLVPVRVPKVSGGPP